MQHVEEKDAGAIFAAETGFVVETGPDVVRAPDVGFVRKDRVPRRNSRGFFKGVPDLAVEVVSFNDTRREIGDKVNMWLAHGTTSVWVADPDAMTITIHRTGQKPIRLVQGRDPRRAALPRAGHPAFKHFQEFVAHYVLPPERTISR